MQDYQIEVRNCGDVFIASFKEMPLSAKGNSEEEAIENLRMAFNDEMKIR